MPDHVLESILARMPKRRGAVAEMAAAIGLEPDKLSKSLHGKRRLQVAELAQIEAWLAGQAAPEAGTGLSDVRATPWTPAAQPDHLRTAAEMLVKFLAGNALAPSCLELADPAPGFALMAGDVVIIDSARTPQDGDIAAVRIVEPDSGDHARTVLVRIAGQWLVSGQIGGAPALSRLAPDTMSLAGPVVASFRPTG